MNRFEERRGRLRPGYSRVVLAALSLVLVVAATSLPAWPAEVLFKGSAISLSRSFECSGTRAAGPYDLMVVYEPKPLEKSFLTVSKDGTALCKVEGSTSVDSSLEANKVRLFTKVDSTHKSIQVDVVLPSEARARIPNQVFYLPLSKD